MSSIGDPQTESAYFLAKDLELRRRLRQQLEARAEAVAAKQRIARQLGTDNEPLVERIHALGLDGPGVAALHLIPLVEVAWADHELSERERSTVIAAAAAHGITPSSEAGQFLAALLEEKPSDELFALINDILHDLLEACGFKPQTVLQLCHDVAAASGSVLGLTDPISPDEQQVLQDLATRLPPEREAQITGNITHP